ATRPTPSTRNHSSATRCPARSSVAAAASGRPPPRTRRTPIAIMSAMLRPTLTLLLLLAVPGALLAQDTETEKQAAREVLAKMAALEQSLDVTAMVSRLTGPNPARDQVIARVKELMDKELLALADDIATHPEIGFQEKRSVQKLTEYLQQHDF